MTTKEFLKRIQQMCVVSEPYLYKPAFMLQDLVRCIEAFDTPIIFKYDGKIYDLKNVSFDGPHYCYIELE